MIRPLQERAGLAVARFRYRGTPPVVSFGRSFSEATNVLVALPDNRADEAAAQGVLRMLRERGGVRRKASLPVKMRSEEVRRACATDA